MDGIVVVVVVMGDNGVVVVGKVDDNQSGIVVVVARIVLGEVDAGTTGPARGRIGAGGIVWHTRRKRSAVRHVLWSHSPRHWSMADGAARQTPPPSILYCLFFVDLFFAIPRLSFFSGGLCLFFFFCFFLFFLGDEKRG
ncbi:hypothetical protein TW95_gp1176 [Pandoravirus inopinatum]|uniref:Transmembrane protein n=1 Tax=Pandoravirus inopinatum TaxID=1605721 RepID=A0A0B5J7N0_9VIRU|nr:hypothetical protein TW95_gp1176 [Pandoravirus inopinatum]AJF97910.1 hypothetical protein [Pandoravirus inopinatum]